MPAHIVMPLRLFTPRHAAAATLMLRDDALAPLRRYGDDAALSMMLAAMPRRYLISPTILLPRRLLRADFELITPTLMSRFTPYALLPLHETSLPACHGYVIT